MKTQSAIDLQKQRQVGEIVQDTFAFIRQEFKPMLGSLLRIAGPYMLLILVAFSFFIYSFGDFFNATGYETEFSSGSMALFGFSYLAIIVLSLVIHTLTQGTILHYARLYQEQRLTPDFGALQAGVMASFWPILGLSLLVGILLVIGFMMCLIPGFYLMVPLLLAYPLLVFRNLGAGEAFSAGFSLSKGNWWRVFGAILLVVIVIMIASSIMFIPSYMYQIFLMMSMSSLNDAQSAMFQDPIYIILNILSAVLQYLLSMILPVALSLLYFDLDERQRATGALNRIANLGKDASSPTPN